MRLINIMDDSLLPDVMTIGKIGPAVSKRMALYVMAAEAAGADAVLSLCSSLGPTIDATRPLVSIPVIKIDDAHTEKAVRMASRIGVMATVATTLGPTADLIREKAALLGKAVKIRECLVNGAFQALMRGNREDHDAMVSEAARRLAPRVECILFAQASMARLADRVSAETGRPVLTSPRLALELARRILRKPSSGALSKPERARAGRPQQ